MIPVALLAFAAAFLASVLLTALVRRVTPRIGLTDSPDSRRKLHGRPIPLGGGLAVFLATGSVLGAALCVPNPWNLRLSEDWFQVMIFMLASAAIVILGLVDDRIGLRGRHKLLGQFAAASIFVVGGLVIRKFSLFGCQIELGPLAVPFTLFWLVGATNAVNLLDGIDGLATTLGILLSLALAILAALTGHLAVAAVAMVFAGSLLGFLCFNFPPASIFLGDAGSMLIGLLVGAMAIHSSLKGPGTVLLAAPMALLTIPIFDSMIAILRRKLAGRSVYATDRAHFHHRLLIALKSHRKVLALVAVCCTVTSAAAIGSVLAQNDLIAAVTALAVVSMFVATGCFGRGEVVMASQRLSGMARSFLHASRSGEMPCCQTAVHVQGSGPWRLHWEALVESADKLGLSELALDVNHPAAQEEFTGSWKRPVAHEEDTFWRIDVPLLASGTCFGHLRAVGARDGKSGGEAVLEFLDLLDPLESELVSLASEGLAASPPAIPSPVGGSGNGNGNGKGKRHRSPKVRTQGVV